MPLLRLSLYLISKKKKRKKKKKKKRKKNIHIVSSDRIVRPPMVLSSPL
jgi:hypothetical protein